MLGSDVLPSVLGMLISVIVIIGAAYWFTRYVAGSGRLGGFQAAGGEGLKVLAQASLGKDQRLVVACAGERYFLLGVTQAQISMLAELTAEEASAWRREEDAKDAPPSFREAFLKQLGKKK